MFANEAVSGNTGSSGLNILEDLKLGVGLSVVAAGVLEVSKTGVLWGTANVAAKACLLLGGAGLFLLLMVLQSRLFVLLR